MTVTRGSWPTKDDEDRHIALGSELQRITPRTFHARAWTISAILDKHRVERVDLMSIDLEGFELQALKGMDMTRHRPTWLLVEERNPEQLIALLSGAYALHSQLSDLDLLFKSLR